VVSQSENAPWFAQSAITFGRCRRNAQRGYRTFGQFWMEVVLKVPPILFSLEGGVGKQL
jgi:hypothetical protein